MEPNEKPVAPTAYESDSAYLDAEFNWLRLHVKLLDLEHRLAASINDDVDPNTRRVGQSDQVMAKELNRRLTVLHTDAESTRQSVDTRLEAHRKSETFKLGLDVLVERYELSDDERLILLSLAVTAVSAPLAMDIYAAWSVFGGTLQIQEVVGLLRPVGVADWLQFRRLFAVSSPLVKNSLVTIDFPSKDATLGDLWYSDVSISKSALAIITGDMDIADDSNDSDEVH